MTEKFELNDKALSCFICGKWVDSTDYQILPGELENPQNSLISRINQLTGKTLVPLISEKDFLCLECGGLMDLMQDLESKLDHVKSTLSAMLSQKLKDFLRNIKEPNGAYTDCENSNSEKNVKFCENPKDKFSALEYSKTVPLNEDFITLPEENSIIDSSKSVKYSCKLCHFSTNCVDQFKDHVLLQHKNYMCSLCQKIFISLEKVHDHIKEVHLAKWTCQLCHKTFRDKVHYVNHTKLHLKGISEESMNQLRKEKDYLLEKVNKEYNKDCLTKSKSNYKCGYCEFVSYSKDFYDDHIRGHVILKMFKCEECGLLFDSKALLIEHYKIHKKLMYKCGICENNFQSKDCVIRHLNEKHKHHSQIGEEPHGRQFKKRKQTFKKIISDFNGEIVKCDAFDSQNSSKIFVKDFSRCNESLPGMHDLDLDHRETKEIFSSENLSIKSRSLTEEEKDNTNCSRVDAHEPFTGETESSVEKTLFGKLSVTQVKVSQCQITENSTNNSPVLDKEDSPSPKERHPSNSLVNSKATDNTVRLKECLLPAFENVNDELEISEIVSKESDYSSSRLRSCAEGINLHATLAKSREITLKPIKVKEIGFKEVLASEIKLNEEYVNSENESEPLWISLNSFVGLVNENSMIQENQRSETVKPSKIFVCGKCGFKSVTALGIKEHIISHNTNQLEKCSMDGDGPISAVNFANHGNEKQTSSVKLMCSYCSWESFDKLQLRHHISKCHLNVKMPYSCWYCTKRFSSQLDLNHHEKSLCQSKIYRCKLCKKGFTRETLLNKHRRVAHVSSKCCFCTKTFINSEELAKHKIKHEREEGYQCLECPRIFKTKTGLKFHSAQHTGEYKFRCQYCNQGFMSRVVYQEHMGKHTKEERYVCDVCGRKFCFQSTYWIHRKWHDTPFPYKCDICERPFRHSSLLKVHKRQHTGERPYNCPHCSRSFSVSGTLKRHLMLHTGEYAFNCGDCEKGFTTKNKFALHLSRVHGNDSMLQQGPPKTEFKMVIRESPKSPETLDKMIIEHKVPHEDMIVENYEEVDSMMVQDGGIVGDGSELLKESSLLLPCAILNDVNGSLETRVVEILVNDETSQAVATVTVEGTSSLVSW